MDCSLPGYSVHGITQARILEWVAVSFSRGPSQTGDWQVDSLPRSHQGSPLHLSTLFNYSFVSICVICVSHPTVSSVKARTLVLLLTLMSPAFSTVLDTFRVFSNESVLPIRWWKYWRFSFSISPSNEYSELISFRIDWFDLLKSLCQLYHSKASVLWLLVWT